METWAIFLPFSVALSYCAVEMQDGTDAVYDNENREDELSDIHFFKENNFDWYIDVYLVPIMPMYVPSRGEKGRVKQHRPTPRCGGGATNLQLGLFR